MRIITSSPYRALNAPLLLANRLLSVTEIKSYMVGIFMHDYINGILPITFSEFFYKKQKCSAAASVAPSGSGPCAKSIPTTSPSSVTQCFTGRSTPSQTAAGASHASSASRSRGTNTASRPRVPASAVGSCSSTRYRDGLVNNNQKKHAVVIGTCLVRGVPSCLNKRDIDSTTSTYPGAEIPAIPP